MDTPTNIGIKPTAEDWKLVLALCKKLGGNTTSVLRHAIRVLAEKEGVKA